MGRHKLPTILSLIHNPPHWLLVLIGLSGGWFYLYPKIQMVQQPLPSLDTIRDETVSPTPPPSIPSPVEMANQIAQYHLFGRTQEKVAPPPTPSPPPPVQEPKKSTYLLAGILFVDLPIHHRRAFIATDNQPERVFKAGDSLPGEGKLLEIHQTRINIDYRGQIIVLHLPAAESLPASAIHGELPGSPTYQFGDAPPTEPIHGANP